MTTQWVLLRGLARDQRHWGSFSSHFRDSFTTNEVLYCDLPGSGELSAIKSPRNISGIVDSIRTHYKTQLADKKISLLAVSLGGMVAADWMHRYPSDIEKAVIINSSSRLNPVWQRIHFINFLKVLMTPRSNIEVRERKVVEIISNRPEIYASLSSEWAKFQQDNPLRYATLFNQLHAAARFQLPKITQPTLLLASRNDRLVNPACSIKLAEHWQTPLIWHSTAGHDLTTDDPEWVINAVDRWQQGATS